MTLNTGARQADERNFSKLVRESAKFVPNSNPNERLHSNWLHVSTQGKI